MTDTVQTEGLSIATKGTAHTPKTRGPTDTCYNPQEMIPRPFNDHAPMSNLKDGSQTVKIDEQPVWIESSMVKPSHAMHEEWPLARTHRTRYRKEATAQRVSDKVFVEGEGVVYTNCETWQNRQNTDGFVDGSRMGEGFANDYKLMYARCGVHTMTGKEGSGKSTRNIGFPPGRPGNVGEEFYIEVQMGDEVELEYTLANLASPEPGEAQCQRPIQGTHPSWSIEYTRGGEEKDHEIVSGAKATVECDDTAGSLIEGAAELGQSREGAGPDSVESIGVAINWLRYYLNPYVINARARACAGSRLAKIKVFPRGSVNFTLNFEDDGGPGSTRPPDPLKTLLNAISKVKSLLEIASYFSQKNKQHGLSPRPVFMKDAQFTLEVAYEKIKETKDGYRQEHVGFKWAIHFQSGPLLFGGFTWTINVANFGGPGARVAAWVAERITGASLSVIIEFTVRLDVDCALTRDVYGQKSLGTTFPITLTLEAGLILQAVGYSVSGGIGGEATFTLGLQPSPGGTHMIDVKLDGGFVPYLWAKIIKGGEVKHDPRIDLEGCRKTWDGPTIPCVPV